MEILWKNSFLPSVSEVWRCAAVQTAQKRYLLLASGERSAFLPLPLGILGPIYLPKKVTD